MRGVQLQVTRLAVTDETKHLRPCNDRHHDCSVVSLSLSLYEAAVTMR